MAATKYKQRSLKWSALPWLAFCAVLLPAIAGCSLYAQFDPHRFHPHGWTPLHQAAYEGDSAAAAALLQNGAKVDALATGNPVDDFYTKEDGHLTALYVAVEANRTDVAQILINAHADVTLATSGGEQPLQMAAQHGNLPLVRLLLAHGADVNRRDGQGNMPIHDANTPEVAVLLLQHGAKINSENYYGMTPLHTARNAQMARFLLKNGAILDKRDHQGRTPLLLATEGGRIYDGRLAVAKALVTYGAKVSLARDTTGCSALEYAVQDNDADLVHSLLDHGAIVNPKANIDTPLLLAAENTEVDSSNGYGSNLMVDHGSATITRLLLEHGADMTARDEDGRTALFRAAVSGHDATVALLLQHGAKVNVRDNAGDTALHWAAENNFPQVVSLLLKYGADAEASDNNGDTPLDWAHNNPIIVPLLERAPKRSR